MSVRPRILRIHKMIHLLLESAKNRHVVTEFLKRTEDGNRLVNSTLLKGSNFKFEKILNYED